MISRDFNSLSIIRVSLNFVLFIYSQKEYKALHSGVLLVQKTIVWLVIQRSNLASSWVWVLPASRAVYPRVNDNLGVLASRFGIAPFSLYQTFFFQVCFPRILSCISQNCPINFNLPHGRVKSAWDFKKKN